MRMIIFLKKSFASRRDFNSAVTFSSSQHKLVVNEVLHYVAFVVLPVMTITLRNCMPQLGKKKAILPKTYDGYDTSSQCKTG